MFWTFYIMFLEQVNSKQTNLKQHGWYKLFQKWQKLLQDENKNWQLAWKWKTNIFVENWGETKNIRQSNSSLKRDLERRFGTKIALKTLSIITTVSWVGDLFIDLLDVWCHVCHNAQDSMVSGPRLRIRRLLFN